jgi:hypothetical protein
MKRPRGAAITAVAAWLLALAVVLALTPALAAENDISFKDDFSATNYRGNSGSERFEGPWAEHHDWGGWSHGAPSPS